MSEYIDVDNAFDYEKRLAQESFDDFISTRVSEEDYASNVETHELFANNLYNDSLEGTRYDNEQTSINDLTNKIDFLTSKLEITNANSKNFDSTAPKKIDVESQIKEMKDAAMSKLGNETFMGLLSQKAQAESEGNATLISLVDHVLDSVKSLKINELTSEKTAKQNLDKELDSTTNPEESKQSASTKEEVSVKEAPIEEDAKVEKEEHDIEVPRVVSYKANNEDDHVRVLANRYNQAGTVLDWEDDKFPGKREQAVIELENGDRILLDKDSKISHDFANNKRIRYDEDDTIPAATIGESYVMLKDDEQEYSTDSPVKEVSIYLQKVNTSDESNHDLLEGSEEIDEAIFFDANSKTTDPRFDRETESEDDEDFEVILHGSKDEVEPAKEAKSSRIKSLWASLGAYATTGVVAFKESKVGKYYQEEGKGHRKWIAIGGAAVAAAGLTLLGLEVFASTGAHHHAMDAHNNLSGHPKMNGNGSGIQTKKSVTANLNQHAGHAKHVASHKHIAGTTHKSSSKGDTGYSSPAANNSFVSDGSQVAHLNAQHNSIYSTVESILPKDGFKGNAHNTAVVTDWILKSQHISPSLAHHLPVGYSVHIPSEHILRQFLEEKED